MATETLIVEQTAGHNVYFTLQNQTGQWFDFSDDTFKAYASVTTTGLAATERTTSGAAVSLYTADLDLSRLSDNLVAVDAVVKAFRRLGGSPAPATDTLLQGPAPLAAQLELLGRREIVVKCRLHTRTTSGTSLQVLVWLEADGVLVPLDDVDGSATCTVVINRFGPYPQLDLDSTDMGSPTTAHRFEATVADPNFTSDHQYHVDVSVTANGVTFATFAEACSVIP